LDDCRVLLKKSEQVRGEGGGRHNEGDYSRHVNFTIISYLVVIIKLIKMKLTKGHLQYK